MAKTGIFYGSTMGNTEAAAELIKEQLGDADLHNINNVAADDLAGYDNLVLGSSTWGAGDLQDDWECFINLLADIDFSGKKVAIFGQGDQLSYPDTYLNAVGTIYHKLKEQNAEIVGHWETDGYSYTESTAEIDGKLVGLALDEDNQSDKTEERIEEWVVQLKKEMAV